MSLATILPSPLVERHRTYVSGAPGTYAVKAAVRFNNLPQSDYVGTYGAGGMVVRGQVDNAGGGTYSDPSTGTTVASTAPEIDLTGLTAGTSYHARFRLEQTPTTPVTVGTVTFNTTTEVITHSAHGLGAGDIVTFSGGTLPTGLVAATPYFVVPIDSNTFSVAATESGSVINLSGSPSGTTTCTCTRRASAWTAFSDGVDTTFDTFAPPAVSADLDPLISMAVEQLTTASLRVTWESLNDNISYLLLEVMDAGGEQITAVQVSALETTAVLTGLADPGDGGEVLVRLRQVGETSPDVNTLVAVVRVQDDGNPLSEAAVLGSIDDTHPITGATELQLIVGVPAASSYAYGGTGAVNEWALSGGPTSLTIVPPTASPQRRIAHLTGAPTQEGIFFAMVSTLRQVGLTRSVHLFPVTIAVTGGLCLGWFHIDPERTDLQLFSNGSAGSYGIIFAAGALELKRGDHRQLHLIFRAGTLDRPGTVLDPTTYTEVRLVVLPQDDVDGEALLELEAPLDGSTVTVEEISGNVTVPLTFKVTSPMIERRFHTLERSPGADPNELAIDCRAEVTRTNAAGDERTFASFPVRILQDLDR